MILLLLPFDKGSMNVAEPSILSAEFLGPLEKGDLADPHLACLLDEALIDGMHSERAEVASALSSTESSCLLGLHVVPSNT